MTDPSTPGQETGPHAAGPASATATDAARARSTRLILAAVLGSITAVGVTLGLSTPLFSVVLDRMGLSASLVGFNTSVGVGATLVAAPLVPWLLRYMGAVTLMMAGVVLSAVALVVAGYLHTAWPLFLIRFVIGVGMSLHWVISETWLNDIAPETSRGLLAGVYSALMGLGFAIGPVILGFTGSEGTAAFLVSAAVILAAGAPLLLLRGSGPAMRHQAGQTLMSVFRLAPVIMLASVISGFVDTATLALLPVYGLQLGMDEATAVFQLTVATIGAVVLQLPIGWLGDRFGRRWVLIGCAVIKAATVALLPAALDVPWLLWPILFVWGGVMVGFYTLALALMGARFRGETLAKATSALVITYCLGSIVGPLAIGGAMDGLGPNGFVYGMIAASLLLAGVALQRLRSDRF